MYQRAPRQLRNSWVTKWVTHPDGRRDLPAVHAIQDRLQLHGPPALPLINKATSLSPWPTYFAAAAELLKSDPPPFRNDLEAFVEVRDANPRHNFLRAGYTSDAAAAIDAGVTDARALVRSLHASRRSSGVTRQVAPRPCCNCGRAPAGYRPGASPSRCDIPMILLTDDDVLRGYGDFVEVVP
jgi:hypothetical protein